MGELFMIFTIKCKTCNQEKPKDAFYWQKNGKIKSYDCRGCYNAKIKAKYHNDPEHKAKHKQRVKDWESRHRGVRRDISKRWRENNPEKSIGTQYAWREKNPEKWQELQQRSYVKTKDQKNIRRNERRAENPEPFREYQRTYYRRLTDEQRALRKTLNRKWRESNRWHGAKMRQQRRFAQMNATPKWGQEGITEIYKAASKAELTVDHIVPLIHPLVCGLHVIYNLQLLSNEDNARKNNRFEI